MPGKLIIVPCQNRRADRICTVVRNHYWRITEGSPSGDFINHHHHRHRHRRRSAVEKVFTSLFCNCHCPVPQLTTVIGLAGHSDPLVDFSIYFRNRYCCLPGFLFPAYLGHTVNTLYRDRLENNVAQELKLASYGSLNKWYCFYYSVNPIMFSIMEC